MKPLPHARAFAPALPLRILTCILCGLLLPGSGCTEPGAVAPPPLTRVDYPPEFNIESERFTFLAGGLNMDYTGERSLDFSATGFLTEFSLTSYHAGTVILELRDTAGLPVQRFVCSSETSLTIRRDTDIPLRAAAVTVSGFTGVAALSVRSRACYIFLSMSGFPTEPDYRWVYRRTRTGELPESVDVVTTPPSPTSGETSVWTVRRMTPGGPVAIAAFRIYTHNQLVWFVPQGGLFQMNEPEPWIPYSQVRFPVGHGARWKAVSLTGLDGFGDADAALDRPLPFLGGSFPDVFRVTNRVRLSTQSLLETTLWIVPGLGIVRIRAVTDNPAHPVEEWTLVQLRAPYMVWP